MSRDLRATGVGSDLAALALLLTTMAAPLTAGAAEMRVVRDAETGELRAPTAVEAQAFERATAALKAQRSRGTAAPLVGGIETRYADGTVGKTLDESDMLFSVATKDADGKTVLQCLPAEQAQKLVKSPKNASVAKAAGKVRHDH